MKESLLVNKEKKISQIFVYKDKLLYSESKKDNFPHGSSPDDSFLLNHLKLKLFKNKLNLDNLNYNKYNF